MQQVFGWIFLLIPGLLVAGQLVSVVNFPLAQRLGLQEKAGASDPMKLRAELYAARWDLLVLIWLPLAGVLMLLDHAAWPILCLIGGAVFVDAGGREAVKILGMKAGGVRVGTPAEQALMFGTYLLMGALGLLAIAIALVSPVG